MTVLLWAWLGCAAAPVVSAPRPEPPPVPLGWDQPLRWVVPAYTAEEAIVATYQPVLAEVGRVIGLPQELVVSASYEEAQEALLTGEADVAVLGAYLYVLTRRADPGVRVVASHVSAGSQTYGAWIVARSGGALQLEDLEDGCVAFVDRRSTSGWLIPAARFLAAGIDPLHDIAPVFAGSHDGAVELVRTGQCAAAAVYDGAVGRASEGIEVIAKGDRVPRDAYVIGSDVPAPVGAAVAGALTGIHTASREGRAILATPLALNGFIPVNDAHYDVVRTVEGLVRDRLGLEELPQ